MNNIRGLMEILETMFPDAVKDGFTQIKQVWRHDRTVITAAAGEWIIFQNARANYIRNNHQAGQLGNFYGVYYWCGLVVAPLTIEDVTVDLEDQLLALSLFTDVQFQVEGKSYIPRTLAQPYWLDFGHWQGVNANASTHPLVWQEQKGSPCHIPVRPQEGVEGRVFWDTGNAQSWHAMKLTWYMLGVEAHRVEQG